ncbi:MAG: NAD(P)-dependent oxidoreductase [bacterium]|nr:NAD(P)-dependent oxidoreductase [bacterium]
MRYLVTGGTGFIGSHLVELLLKNGHNVRVPVRKESSLRYLPVKEKNLELFNCSFSDRELLRKLCSHIDIIFHLAGSTKAPSKKEYFRVNVDFTRNIYIAARESGSVSRFIFFSSQASKGSSVGKLGLKENEFTEPISDYGKSKRKAEEVLSRISGPNRVIVYLSSVFGPRDRDFLTIFKLVKAGIFPYFGLKKRYINVVYVKDLVEQLYQISLLDKRENWSINIASSSIYTWHSFLGSLSNVMDNKFRLIHLPSFLQIPFGIYLDILHILTGSSQALDKDKLNELNKRYWIMDTETLYKKLEQKERFSLEEGLKETYNWYLNKGWL